MGGGSNTTSVTIPAWLEGAAKKGIARAEEVSRIGYTPYYGPDVAAMAPAQIAAMQGTNQMASAFGMPTSDPTAGMPTATNYNGMSAYSSGGMYDAALAELKARRPGQYAAIMGMFIDPVTGKLRSSSYSSGSGGGGTASAAATSSGGMAYGGEGMDRYSYAKDYGGNNGYPGTTSWDTVGSYLPGGMNTSNPGSLKNTIAAALTSGKQAAPTAANRPISRSSASAYGGQSGGGSSGGSSSGGSSSGRNESRR